MRIPVATYRIQINPDFGFADTAGIVPYLQSLGVSDIYAAPIFKARSGSKHGYDIVDPNSLNPELGSETEFRNLITEIRRNGMGCIQDIVPNHMALDGANAMLMDLLENFTHSEFFNYFDIDWGYHPNTQEASLNLPLLAKPYRECMARGEINLVMNAGGLAVVYQDLRLPLRLSTYSDVFNWAAAASGGETVRSGIMDLMRLFGDLPQGPERGEAVLRAKAQLQKVCNSDIHARECLDRAIQAANASGGDLSPAGMLHSLLGKQVFRLLYWRTGSAEINYRRFFNVSRLICVRAEVPAVFEHHHRLVRELLDGNMIDGLRVDHIDGLYDAQGYVSRLRTMAPDAYIVTEKILSPDETLSPHWDIQGTTGYDFLNHLNGIFCKQANAEAFETIYRDFTGLTDAYEDLVYENRRMIVATHFRAAIERLAGTAQALCKGMPGLEPSGHDGLKRALTGLVACFPVYRTYIGPRPPHPADRGRIEEAVEEARKRNPETAPDLEVLKRLILAAAEDVEDSDVARDRVRFVRALQQYTGPVMAKGFEDTVLYVYNRLISLNEVGGDPQAFGMDLRDFHEFNQRRLAGWPHSMNATSTHDTKRGEDVRARINVLSEMPQEFAERVMRWRDLNAPHASVVEGTRVPSSNDEYFLYQTILGAYPFDQEAHPGFLARLEAYMVKAMREAKSLTSWAEPDTAYENGFKSFMRAILDPSVSSAFLSDFMEFAGRVHRYGVYNSLSQTLLKITCPGVPDFYQGSEVWDLNLVDPDNRRPVDFLGRGRLLEDLVDRMAGDLPDLLSGLILRSEDGAIKLFLIHRALGARTECIRLFTEGTYVPVGVEGRFREHLVCFARKIEDSAALVVAPRFLTSLVEPTRSPLGREVWKDTRIDLPEGFPVLWRDAISGRELRSEGGVMVGDILAGFPVALLLHR